MENIFTDYEMLGGYIDKMLEEKYHGKIPATVPQDLRDKSIRELDARIVRNALAALPPATVGDVKAKYTAGEFVDFEKIFGDSGIDLPSIIKNTIETYSKEFIGGENV